MDEEENRGKFVDTNIFLYAIQAHPEFGENSRKILERIDKSEKGKTSLINIAEICWWLEKHNRKDEIKEKIKLICSILNLEIIPLTLEDFFIASELVKIHPIDFNDCLCLALMRRMDIDTIYSNDNDFDKIEWIGREFE